MDWRRSGGGRGGGGASGACAKKGVSREFRAYLLLQFCRPLLNGRGLVVHPGGECGGGYFSGSDCPSARDGLKPSMPTLQCYCSLLPAVLL